MAITVKQVVFRDIIVYFALAVMICITSVIFTGIYSYIHFKELTNTESASSLEASFGYEQANLKHVNSLHSVWTQAYESIVLNPDSKWIVDNIGDDVSKTFGMDIAAVVDDMGKVEFAFSRGRSMNANEMQVISLPLAELLQRNQSSKFNLGVVKEIMRIGNEVFIISIGEIQPSYDQTTRAERAKKQKYLVFAQNLEKAVVNSMRKFTTIESLKFTPSLNKKYVEDYNTMEIKNDGGSEVFGYFVWEQGMNARAIITQIVPGSIIALLVLVALAALVSFNVSRAAGSYDDLITSLKLTSDDLLIAKNAAEKSSKEKTNFLATMSHEIRTPMNGIIGMLSLLRETEMDQQQSAYVNTIQSSSDALMRLVDDILEFSQSESKEMKAHISPVKIRDLVSEIQGLLQPIAVQKNLKFEVFFSQAVPIYVETDPVRLRQIILHLTSNAFKFTKVGHVRINLSTAPLDEEIYELVVQVIDTGIGISDAIQETLFSDFFSSEALNSKNSGQGLGLGIAKNMVNLLGGKINCESHAGQGSVFWFSIPIKKMDHTADHSQEEHPE